MVGATVRGKASFTGLRPLNVARDLGDVAALIEEAFRSDMDAAGKRAVREMRFMGRLGPLMWWLDQLAPAGDGLSPGFVWVEDGRIVGNATVRRASTFGPGWIIGNVAVQELYRGQGIGRQLMQACIDFVRDEGGSWVALEVRADNAPAYHLYRSLGFQPTGELVQLWRDASAPPPRPVEPPAGARIRPPRPGEGLALFSLARSATPEGLQWAAPLRESDYALGWDRRLEVWLSGRSETWRVAEQDSMPGGAVCVEIFRDPREEGRMRLWVSRGRHLHAALASAALGLGAVAGRPMSVMHPAADAEGQETLARFGFRPIRTLAHMRLNLR